VGLGSLREGVREVFGAARAFNQAQRNLAETQRPLREPGSVNMPATSAGVLHELTNLDRKAGLAHAEYGALLVTNGSGSYLTLQNSRMMQHIVLAGQTFEWTQPPGITWMAIKPNAATTLGQVSYIPKMRDKKVAQ
jgi:hypothetical protein